MSRTVKILVGALAAIAIIALCALAVVFLINLLGEDEVTATETVPPAATSTAEAIDDDSWERVKAAGVIVVGTSADYPPFEYYTDDYQIDGFDVALMNDVAGRLGLEIDYRNFAFDGLGGALRVGQIDTAIAAISVIPEREALVDFSNIYLVGEDGILAAEGSGINAVNSVEEMAGYKIGVQRGSVYEQWLLPIYGNDVFSYKEAGDVVRDLTEGRVDLAVLDSQPAQIAVDTGGVKLVGHGLNQQRYAIALQKGAQSLKAEIDRVLNDMHNEGVISKLAGEYLGNPELLPTPTPAPTSTAGPPPACIDGLQLVGHPNLDPDLDNPPVKLPGEPFTKVWQVKNTGTCTWDTSYRLVFASGNTPGAEMGGKPTPLTKSVAPGETTDVSVDLVAPIKAGVYLAWWQMETGNAQAFGERLPVAIEVPAAPTVTPAPTQTPSPGVVFTADRDHIKQGECVTFYWKVENVKEVYFYAEGERWQDHPVTGEGSQVECPPVTTTYYLRVVMRDNSVVTQQITIYVEPVANAPSITRFTVDPPNLITLGQCVTVKWTVEGAVDKVTITANSTILWSNAPTNGNIEDCPTAMGTVGYGIEAVGPGGTSRQQQYVQVVGAATATPQPTAAPDLPVIYSFTVTPNQIEAGNCVDVSWSVGGGTTSVQLLRDGVVVIPNAGFTGQETDCLADEGSYVYRLEAYNAIGGSVFEERTVTVSGEAASNPLAGTNWSATAYYDGSAMASTLPGTAMTAAFGADGSLHGSGGCNSYSSSYVVDGNSLSIGPVSSSQALCTDPAGIMEQENAYFAALQSAASYSMEAGELYIQNSSGTVVVEFIRLDR
jgi:polar amino acid transport system substrate-binding protein